MVFKRVFVLNKTVKDYHEKCNFSWQWFYARLYWFRISKEGQTFQFNIYCFNFIDFTWFIVYKMYFVEFSFYSTWHFRQIYYKCFTILLTLYRLSFKVCSINYSMLFYLTFSDKSLQMYYKSFMFGMNHIHNCYSFINGSFI